MNSPIGDPENPYDRFVVSTFAICFQIAEVLLIIGAFKYASVKSGSLMLSSIATVLSWVGSMWLGLILPSTIGRLPFWRKTSRGVRYTLAAVMMGVSILGAYMYMQAIAAIATYQP